MAWSTLVVAGAIFAERHWLLNLTGQFLLLTPLATLIAGVAAFLSGRHWRMANASVLFALSLLLSWPWVRTASQPAGTNDLALLEFNVWSRNHHPEEIVHLVRAAHADIVALVEVSPFLPAYLHSLDRLYPYRIDCSVDPDCGTLLLSRFPLRRQPAVNIRSAERDLYTRALVDAPNCPVTLMATHLLQPFPRHAKQQLREARELGRASSLISGPTILAGDFNAAPWSPVMRTIQSLGHLRIASGLGGTYPSLLPQLLDLPIDHVLVSAQLKIESRKVLGGAGSDHLPVLVRIGMPHCRH